MASVYLFLDTNVLVQCRALKELRWRELIDVSEFNLIISRPVQTEIDFHKNKGKERLARRARDWNGIFRELLVDKCKKKTIVPSNPIVNIILDTTTKESPELSDSLNYSEVDDRLVGITHAFMKEHPECDVRLLTHDIGPMVSAQMVDVPIAPVPDDWLLPPEAPSEVRLIQKLKEEIKSLKEVEPKLSAKFVNVDSKAIDRLEFRAKKFYPLASDQIAELIDELKRRFPEVEDFGGDETIERPGKNPFNIPGYVERFIPATDKEILEYRQKYEKWIDNCTVFLKTIHTKLQRLEKRMAFICVANNEGTRPADSVLVTFRARGDFRIMPVRSTASETGEEGGSSLSRPIVKLPRPPAAPSGKWSRGTPIEIQVAGILKTLQPQLDIPDPNPVFSFPRPDDLLRNLAFPEKRDPNAFYPKPKLPESPVSNYSLECSQWRHGTNSIYFCGYISSDHATGPVRGAIECTIHASNLREVHTLIIPVHIEITTESVYEVARRLVSELGTG